MEQPGDSSSRGQGQPGDSSSERGQIQPKEQQQRGGAGAAKEQQRGGGAKAKRRNQRRRGAAAALDGEGAEDQHLQGESGGRSKKNQAQPQQKERGPRAGVEVWTGALVRIKKEGNWRKEDMERAALQVIAGKQQQKATRDNNVPYSTLRRRVKGEGERKGAPTVLPRHVEQMIVDWIKEMSNKALSSNKRVVEAVHAAVARHHGAEMANFEQGQSHGSQCKSNPQLLCEPAEGGGGEGAWASRHLQL
jgi:hypothetical protein